MITDNESVGYVGGIYLGGSTGTFAPVTVSGTIIAENIAALPADSEWGDDVGAEATARDFYSLGNNRIGSVNPPDVGFNATGDYMGNVNYIVTGVADTWNSGNDEVVVSVREAINKANLSSGPDEIWLPGWHFLLMRDRNGYGQGSLTDVSVGFGDLDISDSLTIRAVNSASRVTWRAGLAADKVFELLGDYNGNNSVDTGDYVIWQKTLNSTTSLWADVDGNGTVQQADYLVWSSHYGNTLTLLGIQVDGSLQA